MGLGSITADTATEIQVFSSGNNRHWWKWVVWRQRLMSGRAHWLGYFSCSCLVIWCEGLLLQQGGELEPVSPGDWVNVVLKGMIKRTGMVTLGVKLMLCDFHVLMAGNWPETWMWDGGEIRTREIAMGMIRAEFIAETLGKNQPRGSGEWWRDD